MKLSWEKLESSNIIVYQPATGHRYGEESLALAKFVDVHAGQRVVELGSGVGIISLLIAAQKKPSHIDAVELQHSLHEIAKKNVAENGYDQIVSCINDDFRSFAQANSNEYDVVISNPPFFTASHGRLSPDPQRAAARHELNGTIEDLVSAAYKLLVPLGKFFVVFDSRRNFELKKAANKQGLKDIRIESSRESSFVLIEFNKARPIFESTRSLL